MKNSKKLLLLAAAAGGVLTYLYRYEIEQTVRDIKERLSAEDDGFFDSDEDLDDDCIIHRDPAGDDAADTDDDAAADIEDADDSAPTEDDFADEEPENKD